MVIVAFVVVAVSKIVPVIDVIVMVGSEFVFIVVFIEVVDLESVLIVDVLGWSTQNRLLSLTLL